MCDPRNSGRNAGRISSANTKWGVYVETCSNPTTDLRFLDFLSSKLREDTGRITSTTTKRGVKVEIGLKRNFFGKRYRE